MLEKYFLCIKPLFLYFAYAFGKISTFYGYSNDTEYIDHHIPADNLYLKYEPMHKCNA